MIEEKVLKSFKHKNVLITGGTGLIGRQVVRILCDAEANVKIVSLDKIITDERAEHVFGDLSDFSLCRQLVKDMDFVFHVAGVKGSVKVTQEKPASFFVPLLMMNTNVLEACRLEKVDKVVYVSSVGAYPSAEVFVENDDSDGAPMDMFPGWAKRMAEMQVKAYSVQYGLKNFSVVRPANIYGPGDNFDPENAMVIPSLMHRIYSKEDPVMIWGDGSAIRDFAYSEDIAEGIILALYFGTDGKYVNLGSGIGYSIKELVETLHKVVDFNYEFDITKSSGFPRRIMDISLARKRICFDPTTSLLDGLTKTWDWFINNQNEHLLKNNYFV